MANKSLGTLVLNLTAKTGEFVKGLDKSTRELLKFKGKLSPLQKSLKSLWTTVKNGTLAFSGLSSLSFANLIKQTSDFEQGQAQLQAVLKSTGGAAGFTGEELNKLGATFANNSTFSTGEITKAQTALLAFSGIVGGDFVKAQQAAADMATRTGMSIDAAAEVIGRALDVPSQGLTALSRQGFRFTDSQKELVKFLEATGRASEAQGVILQALSESYDGASASARDTFSGALGAVKNSINDLMTGGGGDLDGAKNALNDLNTALQSNEIKTVWSSVVTSVTSALSGLINNFDTLLNILDVIKRSLASVTNTVMMLGGAIATVANAQGVILAKATDFVGLTKGRAEQAINSIKASANFTMEAFKGFGDIWSGDLGGTALLKDAQNQTKALNIEKSKSLELSTQELDAYKKAQEAQKQAQKLEQERLKQAEKARQAELKAREKARLAYEKQQEAINNELASLEKAVTIWGKTAGEVKLYDLALKGANEKQLALAKAQLDILDNLEKQKAVNDNYCNLVQDLKTQEELRRDILKDQLNILDKQAQQAGKIDKEALKRVLSKSFDAQPEYDGKDKEKDNNVFTRLDNQQAEQTAWYNSQLEKLAEYRQERAELAQEWDEKEQELTKQHGEALVAIEKARQEAIITQTAEYFNYLSGLQQSKSKTAQQVGKGAAIVEATIATYTSATKAFNAMVGIPLVGPALGATAAAAAIASGMANVQRIKGVAHDGLDKVPTTGTWLLEKGERVTSAKTSAKLDNTLNKINQERNYNYSRQNMRNIKLNQNINVSGAIDNHTARQIATESARRQRFAEARYA